MLIVTRDESPLFYRAPDASEDSNFDCSTALFQVTMYRQFAWKVGTSANSALIRYYLPRLKMSISTRKRTPSNYTCISCSFPTIQYVSLNPPPSTMPLEGLIFLARYVHSHADGSAYVCQICSQSVHLFGIFPTFFNVSP